MFTARGLRLLLRIGKQASEKKGKIEITSIGQDRAGHRFDDWELAAARLAAAARPLREAGLPDDRIELRGLDDRIDAGVDPDAGQHILFRQKDRKSVVEGKSVSVRVDLGGRRIIKKKIKKNITIYSQPNKLHYIHVLTETAYTQSIIH